MEASENKNEYAGHGVANTGPALGATALGLNLLQNGGLGGLLGGNRPPVCEPPWSRDMNYERSTPTSRLPRFGRSFRQGRRRRPSSTPSRTASCPSYRARSRSSTR